MERFGAAENVPTIAKSLKNMVGTRRLELLTSTVSIAFPQTTYPKTPLKQPIFGDELVTSFLQTNVSNPILCERFSARDTDPQLSRVAAS